MSFKKSVSEYVRGGIEIQRRLMAWIFLGVGIIAIVLGYWDSARSIQWQ